MSDYKSQQPTGPADPPEGTPASGGNPDLRLNRSNPLYESIYDLKAEKKREVSRFAMWTDASKRTAWLVSPIFMTGIAGALLAIAIGSYFLQLSSSNEQANLLVETVTPPAQTGADEIESVHEAISGFVNAPTIEEKLKFVRSPEQSRRKMEEYYTRVGNVQRQVVDYTMIAKTDSPPRYLFFVAQALFNDNSRQIFTVMPEDQRYLIDWESTVGFNPMEWDTYLRLKPDLPMDWRLHLTPADFYTGKFSDTTKWRSVKLGYPKSDEVSYAWYATDQNDATDIARLMQIGPNRAVIVKLTFVGDDERQVQLLKLVNDTWIIP